MQEMDEELQAAVEVARKLGEETQRQDQTSVLAQPSVDADTVRQLREENEKLRSELDARAAADRAQEVCSRSFLPDTGCCAGAVFHSLMYS